MSHLIFFGDSSEIKAYRNNTSVDLTDTDAIPALDLNAVYGVCKYNNANYPQSKISEIFSSSYSQYSNKSLIYSDVNSYYGINDKLTNQIVLLSTRKAKSTYSGYCMKVRRSSDDTTQDIGFSGSDLDTTSLLSFVGAGSGYVHTWYDQSGNSNNATQTTNANQPRIVLNGTLETENTKPIINFGTNSNAWYLVLPTGFLYQNSDFFIFNGIKKLQIMLHQMLEFFSPSTTNSTGIEILMHSVVSKRTLLRINGSTYNDNSGAAYQMWDNATFTLTSIFSCFYENSVYKNGSGISLTKTNGIATLTFNGIYAIGRYSTSYYMYGKIAEIQIFPTYQADNRTTIESDINDYYSIY